MSTCLHFVAKDTSHLRSLVESEMQKHGSKCDLNHIDVSQLSSFSDVFWDSNFNGDLSKWDMRDLSTYVLAQYPTRHSRTIYTESWRMGEDALSDEGCS